MSDTHVYVRADVATGLRTRQLGNNGCLFVGHDGRPKADGRKAALHKFIQEFRARSCTCCCSSSAELCSGSGSGPPGGQPEPWLHIWAPTKRPSYLCKSHQRDAEKRRVSLMSLAQTPVGMGNEYSGGAAAWGRGGG